MRLLTLLSVLFLAVFSGCTAPPAEAQPGTTRIAKWQGDKKAVFLLMFDDGWPSHWQVALPELKKRDMIGTFYVCPAKGEFKKFEAKWTKDMLEAGMVLANHTMSHNGMQSLEDAEWEFGDATKYILKNSPGKPRRLISFGRPGVDVWKITEDDYKNLIAKNDLIDRPDFRGHGANYHIKTLEQYLALADKAIASGGMEYIVYHGLERTENWGYQDMWAVKQEVFFPFLDGLQERRDRGDLWITDHISYHKYDTERTSAKVETLESNTKQIRLKLTSAADPEMYDLPLTLASGVPANWKKATVTQGTKTVEVTPANGQLQYEALPSNEPILIKPAA